MFRITARARNAVCRVVNIANSHKFCTTKSSSIFGTCRKVLHWSIKKMLQPVDRKKETQKGVENKS